MGGLHAESGSSAPTTVADVNASLYDASTALVVVDMQNDFAHPDGSLFVSGGDALLGPVNDEIAAAADAGAVVVLTQDWHPPSTPHFVTDGGVWPVHCVAGTWGAELVDGLDPDHRAGAVIRKGTNGEDGYSAFMMREPDSTIDIPTGLAGLLRERGVARVVVVGLATDVCVAATAGSAAAAGFATTVLWAASRPGPRRCDDHRARCSQSSTAPASSSPAPRDGPASRPGHTTVTDRPTSATSQPLHMLGTAIRDRWTATRGPLFCDMYELTMAQVYVREGLADRTAQFDAFYRSNPDYGTHQAGYCVAAGLGPFLDWLGRLRVTDAHVAALAALRSPTGAPVFEADFLDWIADPDLFAGLEIHAIDEGRVVHPNEPIVSVTGPLGAAQLIETALLNHLNYPTLIATKAARVVSAARGGAVLEFGMRRGPATGVNDGIRAALIGGCVSTSDVEAAIACDVVPSGTHAHSLVQAYLALGMGELAAFRASAAAAPDGCILLVDTIDTLTSGVPNAITVFDELRAQGHEPVGVRLDSGDLAYLAVQTARLLDDAGFAEASIVLSSDLDELTIWQIRDQIRDDARRVGLDGDAVLGRLVYGVGTRLITSAGDSALNGVYKLVGIADADGAWQPAIKVSEDPGKIPLPGPKLVWRLHDHRGVAVTDLVGLADEDPLPDDENLVHHPVQSGIHKTIRRSDIGRIEPLHQKMRTGASGTSIADLAARCRADIGALNPGVQRLVNPHRYHVSITDRLHRLRLDLLADLED